MRGVMKGFMLAVLAASAAVVPLQAAGAPPAATTVVPHEVEDFVRQTRFHDIRFSPTGEYFAATLRVGGQVGLAIIRRADVKTVSLSVSAVPRQDVNAFWWVNDREVVFDVRQPFDSGETPVPIGMLFVADVSGAPFRQIAGVGTRGGSAASRFVGLTHVTLVDTLPADDAHILVAVTPLRGNGEGFTELTQLEIATGKTRSLGRAPVHGGEVLVDNAGVVRLSWGFDRGGRFRVFHRPDNASRWTRVAIPGLDEERELYPRPLGFEADDQTVLVHAPQPEGPDALLAWHLGTGASQQRFRHPQTDFDVIWSRGVPVGATAGFGRPVATFFDPQGPEARLQATLERAFPGQEVVVTSRTRDGQLAMVYVHSDRQPGEFYVYDAKTRRVEFLMADRDWLDPARTAEVRTVTLKARDGLELHGLLTAPVGREARNAPMVVLVHGGPFDASDAWGFDVDAQLLAAHGYAVLQVNFRGSGGRGHAFVAAGRQQWGRAMQDDVTDATRWAIAEGIADPARICIAGASYGAYSALMGVIREPGLYRCAVGTLGVYDLPLMFVRGDIAEGHYGRRYLREWIGPSRALDEVSPYYLADQVKVPVFLAAGGEDERAPQRHTEKMERALRKAGASVEAVYFPTEAHDIHTPDNLRTYYAGMLRFLARHLGGREPRVEAVTAPAATTGGDGAVRR